jgi:transcriptional regulator with XRE-family HTH domain
MLMLAHNVEMPSRWRMPSIRAQSTSEQAKDMGRALKAMRDARGLTQQAAAELMGVSRQTLQNYENGRAIILRIDVQTRLARALGGERDELLSHLEVIQGHGRVAMRADGAQEATRPYDVGLNGQAVFPLREGKVTVTFPENLSPEGFAELADYLALFLKTRAPKGA